MDIQFLKVLTSRIGEWVALADLFNEDDIISKEKIHSIFEFINNYDDIFIRTYEDTLWLSFYDEEPKFPPKHHNYKNHLGIIVQALSSWSGDELPCINYADKMDSQNEDTWIHFLARIGEKETLHKILRNNENKHILLNTNKFGELPCDVAKPYHLQNELRKLTTSVIEEKKDRLKEELQVLKCQMSMIEDRAKKYQADIQNLVDLMPKTNFWSNNTVAKIGLGFLGGLFMVFKWL